MRERGQRLAGDLQSVWPDAVIVFIVSTLLATLFASVGDINFVSDSGNYTMAIESARIPLPSEIIMPFSGYLVSVGQFSLIGAVTGARSASISVRPPPTTSRQHGGAHDSQPKRIVELAA